ncbi:hypothetical protein Vafri_3480 [Volvox africanus]|uniref:Uncharacterized protein n=1 Tax=Volvox africanus TaxID=51714 RepID=A0A8J4ASV9_9CHLO|nr:hypothetical protein Vafri_3480 [Volvox africanus]
MKSAPAKTGVWTEEEDILLVEYQALYGNKWSLISKHIPGRNGQSCAQRWRHKVNPNIIKDKWTLEEDSILTKLVQEIGVGKWATVARHLPGRTDQQCMGRWRRHLDPNIRKDAWTTEEDARLQELYEEHGSAWSMIAKRIANRTPQQCRGRWCILTASKSKATMRTLTIPDSKHATRDCTVQGSATAMAAGIPGHGRAQLHGCPSTVAREADTEVPVMPASTIIPMHGNGDLMQPPTVHHFFRLTRSRVRASVAKADSPKYAGLLQGDRRPAILQDPASAAARAFKEKPEGTPQTCAHQKGDITGTGPTGAHRGRLLLGTQVLSFQRRPRSTQCRPRSRLTAILLPAFGGSSSGRVSKRLPLTGGGGAAGLPLSSRTQSHLANDLQTTREPATWQACDAEQRASQSQGVDGGCRKAECDDPVGVTASLPCQAIRGNGVNNIASTCERPTVSTSSRVGLEPGFTIGCSSQRPAGRTEEAVPGDVLHMPMRKTRSGRCYPLVMTPAGTSTKPNRHDKTIDDMLAVKSNADIRGKVANVVACCRIGLDAASLGPSAADPGQRNCVNAAAARSPDDEARMVLPEYNFFSVQAPDGGAHQITDHSQQAMLNGSGNTSLSLPDGLFGEAGTPPGGDQILDWGEVIGSPPTSSFLAFVEAGILQTPSVAPGPGPGPELLCAPVPPGMPKVTPDSSNEWSDVPALSWTELQACHGGFGIVGHHSAHGTPDNSQPALRAVQANDQAGITPRRDMYVRSAGQLVAAGSTSMAAHYIPGLPLCHGEAAGVNEGQGDTRSMPPSPGGRNPCLGLQIGSLVNGADGRQMGAKTVVSDCPPPSRTAKLNATNGDPPVPDFCSPARKQHVVVGSIPGTKAPRVPGLPDHFMHGSDFFATTSFNTSSNPPRPVALTLDGVAAHAHGSVPPCLGAAMSEASPHLCLGMQSPVSRPSLNEGRLLLPPVLTSALLPTMTLQLHDSCGAGIRSSHQPPPAPEQQLPAFAATGTSADGGYCMPMAVNFGGLVAPTLGSASSGLNVAFPRLMLPKLPAPGTVRSLFPVLSLHNYQAGKENVMR